MIQNESNQMSSGKKDAQCIYVGSDNDDDV